MGDALLVADIGGTNARFALADPHAASPLLVASVREFPVAAFPSLAEAAAHYLDQVGTRARRGVFAVAGRIDGDQARITNHPWVISRSRTAQMLGFDQVHLLNDFAAQAMAIRLFGPDDVVRIGAPDWSPARCNCWNRARTSSSPIPPTSVAPTASSCARSSVRSPPPWA